MIIPTGTDTPRPTQIPIGTIRPVSGGGHGWSGNPKVDELFEDLGREMWNGEKWIKI